MQILNKQEFKIEVLTKDGYLLKGTMYEVEHPKAMILLNPGTATKTSFYIPFAQYLVEQGYNVFLWNYRGFCESLDRPLKNSSIKYSDVGMIDIPTIITEIKKRYPTLDLICVGHSAGGQQIGFAHNHHELKGLVAIAVSTGYFFTMPMLYRMKALFFFKFFAPVFGKIYGFVPAKKFNFMESLPLPLTREWGEWCSYENYFFSDRFYGKTVPAGSFKDLKFPVHVITADDDEISTPDNVKNFWRHVQSTQGIKFYSYKGRDFESGFLGHFGYFKKSSRQIWEQVTKILEEISTKKIS